MKSDFLKRQLPAPALAEWLGAFNAACAQGTEHNDAVKAAWAEVYKGWERPAGKPMYQRKKKPKPDLRELGTTGVTNISIRAADAAMFRKMNPTPGDVHIPVPMGGQKWRRRRKLVVNGFNPHQVQKLRASKDEAEYVDISNKQDQCADCSMFTAPDGCTAVAGTISPEGWCKWFERAIEKTAEKKLYVFRPLLNGDEVQDWAKQQGLKSTLAPDDMHCTICYSKKPVDWSKFEPDDRTLTLEDGYREVEMFDGGALVLHFDAPALHDRWEEFQAGGTSYDYDEYKPHVTVTYEADDANIEPYTGPLVFGPEEFREITSKYEPEPEETLKGEPAGHPFRGNQYTGGIEGDGGEDEDQPDKKGKATYDDFINANIRIYGVDPSFEAQDEFADNWNKNVGMSPEEFKNQFLGGARGTMRIEYNKELEEYKLYGDLRDEKGLLGVYTSTLEFGDNKAHANALEIRESAQKGGQGVALHAANVEMFQKLGLDKVSLLANVDIGSYAWARFGYVPDANGWKYLQRVLTERLDHLPSADSPAMRKLISSDNPKAVWAIADSPHGYNMLESLSWDGELDFSDAESMARYKAYIGRKSKKH